MRSDPAVTAKVRARRAGHWQGLALRRALSAVARLRAL